MGDLSENAAYQIAKSRLRGLQSRLLVIADRLARASVLVPPTDGCIGLGSTVTLRASTGSEQVWQVVSRMEVDIARGRISDESVVGKALMGKREGEEVAWETPKGIARSTVVRVE
jgi:transcription elongation GreA/GreB family factor